LERKLKPNLRLERQRAGKELADGRSGKRKRERGWKMEAQKCLKREL